MKDFSKIIKGFEKLPYKGYVQKRCKHEPTDSYFYLVSHIAQCMMTADSFNFQVDLVRTEITGMQHIPILHICSSDNSKSEGIITDKNLSQVYCTDDIES